MKPAETTHYHKLLQRQVAKYCDETALQQERFRMFLDAVNESYIANDKDKELSEHAFLISQEDYAEINRQLREEIELRQLSIQKLQEAIRDVRGETKTDLSSKKEDLLTVLDLLQQEISKRKAAEEETQIARDVAVKASQAKTEFLSVMSHEIRTPLNAVIGMGHLLLKGQPRPDQVENLKALKTAADHLLVLVNDVLDFNKIEAGKLELETIRFNPGNLIRDIAAAHLVSARDKQNELRVLVDEQIPESVEGDAIRLAQVLNNLISNAAKFTSNGKIAVTAKLMEKDDRACSILFSVTDTGIGIPPDKLASIFDPFTQASSSITRRFGGTGLGLAISQRILQLMESRLNVTSEEGKGSHFYFVLDLPYYHDKLESEQVGPINYNLEGKRILLVEDTLFNVMFATQLLESWNGKVEVAENGQIAVNKIREQDFDLVLMDLQMPVMDGYTATIRIREFNTELPIIALTASASTNVRGKVIEVGMQDYLTKPINPEDFFHRMARQLKLRS